MHGERVTRHNQGAEQSMLGLQHKYDMMTATHNEKTEQFFERVNKLETIFNNATTSAK